MRPAIFLSVPVVLLLGSLPVQADNSDPAAARAQLQQGYALKQLGRCEEALPHFEESVRLDRQPKALVNLADCEEKLGKLAAAQQHFVEARDMANGLEALRNVAEQHLAALEKRMPRLTVRVAKGAPPDTAIIRDGVKLGPVSLNTPLPLDPGKHTVVARGGNLQKTYEVTLTEAETKELDVTPQGGVPAGPEPTPASSAPAVSSPSLGTAVKTTASSQSSTTPGDASTSERPSSNATRIAGFTSLGLGAVGLAAGTVFALQLSRKNDTIDSTCPPPRPCPPEAVLQYNTAVDDAKTARTLSIVGFGAGAAFIGTGAVLLLSAKSTKTSSSGAIWYRPVVGPQAMGLAVDGTW